MASTYTTNLGLTLPTTGELAGTWGSTVNSGVTTLIDDAVSGTSSVTMTGANKTLTATVGVANEARSMFITLGGSPGGSYNVIVPSTSKLYFVTNNTGYSQTIKTSGGTGISVATGTITPLYCDATNVVNAVTPAVTLGANTFTAGQNFARATVASHATTADIWAAAGNQIDWTGTATTTIFPNAPQAGAERVLICAGACSFTAGANMLIDGVASAATVTCAANDQVIVRAVSTTQFKLSRVKYDGTAQVGSASASVPVGAEMLWPTEIAPTGWLEENGASLLRAGTYADLYAVIGTTYGTADGTHFNLPDARGRFIRGWDHGAARDPDRASRTADATTGATMTAGDHVGTLQADAFKAHVHAAKTTLVSLQNGAYGAGVADGDSGSTGGNETRPINTNRMMIIKY